MTDKQAQYRPKFSQLWERYDEAAKDNAVHMSEILEQALDALEAAERHIAISERVAGQKLEAAERRIAELEAREVKLPPTFWYEHDDLPREIPVLSRRLVINALREAGVKIAAGIGKGE